MFYFIMAAVAAAVVGLDQWTKWLTVQNVPLYAEGKSILGIFSITHIENNGGAWGMLGGQMWLFLLVMVVFLALLVIAVWKKWLTKKFELLCLAAIAGGGIGNMIDRLRFGRVTDMIKLDFVEFPVFNVADCFITTGCVLLLIYILFFDRQKKKTDNEAAN